MRPFLIISLTCLLFGCGKQPVTFEITDVANERYGTRYQCVVITKLTNTSDNKLNRIVLELDWKNGYKTKTLPIGLNARGESSGNSGKIANKQGFSKKCEQLDLSQSPDIKILNCEMEGIDSQGECFDKINIIDTRKEQS